VKIFGVSHNRESLIADLSAGIVLGIVALPLAIAFAIASGVKPEQGLYTAIIAGFVVAALGGSRFQVTGPTGAFIVVVYSIVSTYGYQGLALATMMAGVMILIMGLSGMGRLLKFVPYPLIVGFTSGIAVIVFSSQLNDLLGMGLTGVPAGFIDKWKVYLNNLERINLWALGIGMLSIAFMFLIPKSRIPNSLIVIVFSTLSVSLFNIPVETIETRFGGVPNSLPRFELIPITLEAVRLLFSPALTIALLSAIESLLSATVADGMTNTRHSPNKELISLGIGNILTPLFGGIPATGAIARTATNIRSGAHSPIAAMTHAVVLLVILLVLGDFAQKIPLAALAGILIFIAYNMAEVPTFIKMFKAPGGDVVIMLTTFILTVVMDLTIAIEVGILLSALIFLKRMESSTEVALITQEITKNLDEDLGSEIKDIPKNVEVFALEGPLFFGVIERFENAINRISDSREILILRMRNVPIIDAAGIHALSSFYEKLKSRKKHLILSGLRPQPKKALIQSGVISNIGEQNCTTSTKLAIERAREISAGLFAPDLGDGKDNLFD